MAKPRRTKSSRERPSVRGRKTSARKSATLKSTSVATAKPRTKPERKPVRSTPAKSPRRAKWVYAFGGGKAEGRADMRNLLGGKGANLAEMANLGLPVPPGFTITTEGCTYFYAHGKTYPPPL